jgi:hypothetical protein
MPMFTFIPQTGETAPDPREAFVLELPSAEAARTVARQRLVSSGAQSASIALGEGQGDDVDWLGAWDYAAGGEPVWSPDD